MSNSRITADLGDPQLLKLLKAEANINDTSIKDVLVTALEGYFAHRMESRDLSYASEEIFDEWNDKRDSDYDAL